MQIEVVTPLADLPPTGRPGQTAYAGLEYLCSRWEKAEKVISNPERWRVRMWLDLKEIRRMLLDPKLEILSDLTSLL